MKLILAIVNKEDAQEVSHALTKEKFPVTKLATQGGFLMSGNTTLIIGIDDDKVDAVLNIIKEHSRQRKEIVHSTATYGIGVTTSFPLEVTVGGATIFVLNVERFEKA